MKYYHVFGRKCYILADRDLRTKLDPKSDEGIFLGYSTNSRSYRVFNTRTEVMMESINVMVDESIKEAYVTKDVETSIPMNDVSEDNAEPSANLESEVRKHADKGPSIRIQKDRPKDLIIGNFNGGVTKISREMVSNACFVSKFEPKNVKEALTDEF